MNIHADIAEDTRTTYCDLVGESAWQSLPRGTRARFGQVFRNNCTRSYLGEVIEARLSWIGWCLAQLCRLIGAPLPLFSTPAAAAVTVTDHPGNSGQVWVRAYHRERGFAQCIQSVKRMSGPTGLEEYLGYGVSMPLAVSIEGSKLVFCSAGYQLQLGGHRFNLPRGLHPGALTVVHEELGPGEFTFTMQLLHPIVGELIYQKCWFSDAPAAHTSQGAPNNASSTFRRNQAPSRYACEGRHPDTTT